MLLEINPHNPEYPKIKQVVTKLKQCGVIVYPTDTIYGLGCDIFCPEAIDQIYKIKQKKATGFSFICSDLKEIAKYAHVSDVAYRIMKKVLPGPYTFVFKSTKLVPQRLIPEKKTVAIRIPDNAICLEIVKQLGHPIVSTSVNITGEPYYSDPLQIEQELGSQVDVIIDAGLLENDPSTVIDFTTDKPTLIRQGKGSTEFLDI
ncbi:MAG: Sua5/YciO/YrdC/YwlC [Parcubacteria group bacterium GW2011_GWC2_38_7]|nr:MAG: Sua5/YciO/YrdC/YwlC [Parcubacteria group bacterium GW2011_GWC2_38_7]